MTNLKKALRLQNEQSKSQLISERNEAQNTDDLHHPANIENHHQLEKDECGDSGGESLAFLMNELLDERLPEHSIIVDLEQLRQFGLLPNDSDIQLVEQQFRRIKRPVLSITFGAGDSKSENSNIVMLASAMPNSGKSFCSFNLATSIARERDFGTILVDADVLNPYISSALGLENHVGLVDYLLDSTISLDDIMLMTDQFGTIVIPAGRQNTEATELLASRRMKAFFKELSERFRSRTIIVDTPPLLLTNEAHVLADLVGQIVLVIEAGVTTHESVAQVINSLDQSKPINVILNKVHGSSYGDYGSTAYGYHSASRKGR